MPCAAVRSRSDTYYAYRPSDEQLGFARKRLKVGENRRKIREKSSDGEAIDAKPRFLARSSRVSFSYRKRSNIEGVGLGRISRGEDAEGTRYVRAYDSGNSFGLSLTSIV